MLQPRISLRSFQQSCKCFSSILLRTYASVVESQSVLPDPLADVGTSFAPPPTHEKGELELRTYKPRTPGLRHLRRPVNDHLWKGRPIKELTFPKKGHGKGGRNHTGHITVRHRGGGHKRRIRTVDFDRKEPGPHVVERIEHDPNRSAHIALLRSKATKKLSYIIAADGMREGDVVQSYRAGIPKDLWESMGGVMDPGVLAAKTAWRGNCLPLHMIPIGTLIYNVGLHKDKGAQLCRSAGTFATVVAKAVEGHDLEADVIRDDKGEMKPLTLQDKHRLKKLSEHVTIRLQSSEIRLIHKDCCATIGVASNANFQYRRLGKAGRKRWLGIRPTVRGLAMNAMDHPHGGGRGKSKGHVHPKSPWGLPAKSGYRTRPKRKVNKAVVTPRERNQGKRRRGYN
ncbi:mitochondrial 54S ribosomal protein rml2 [Emydomyces testavorans]|uniref:Large ribosomal subunit protein uL2m n=1 Tax=Emydomyces testavorans TaxID=2070801 RepID=A0AAF0DKW4_9EURO|nr:mitochondrial 54S ribosomal protein rml2 [Emydomyces testavorans]